ncbi:hypothetical protein OZD63_05420 [Wolbachia endosymbiont of Drosophila leontia]|nr:hypothetical protein [Wolbachia endosymbiont of Drosophila leontia]MDE5067493.1 hypothetical protein [Wolbachia endosymbiont of Drosophila leontia]
MQQSHSSVKHWNDTIYYSNYLQIAMFVHQKNESRYDVWPAL